MYFTNKVIDKLKLKGYYENFENPWYVPKEEEFKTLLDNEGFKNIRISKKKTCFKYNSVKEAYDFLDSVGIKLFLECLPQEKKDLFINELKEELNKLCIKDEIELNFERIFVFADY